MMGTPTAYVQYKPCEQHTESRHAHTHIHTHTQSKYCNYPSYISSINKDGCALFIYFAYIVL